MRASGPHHPRGRLALLATALVAVLLLPGCARSTGTSQDGLNVLVVKSGLSKPIAEMGWPQQVAEAAGVPVRWQEVSSDWDLKKNPMLAAGDVPDVIIGSNVVTDEDLSTFGPLFEDLRDDLPSMPHVQQMLDEVDGAEELATTDGKVYALPSYKKYWPQAITHQYINEQWLDALGLPVPTTWDELFTTLQAFKERDPNGNGQADEVPFDFSPVGTTGFGYFQPSALLGSTGLQVVGGGGSGYFLEDGEVKNFFTDPRYRDVVEFLHRCWEAGLVNPAAFTQDYSTYQSLARGSGDTARVGFSWGWTATDRFGTGVAGQYQAMGPLQQSAGQAAPVRWSYDFENLTPNHLLISSKTLHKDAALRLADAFYAPDTSIQVLFGQLGTNVEKTGDEAYTVLPPADPELDPSTWKWTSTFADIGPYNIGPQMQVQVPQDVQQAAAEAAPLEPAFEGLDVARDVYPAPFIKLDEDDTLTTSLNDTAIQGLAMPRFAQWVTAGGADRGWDRYVQDLRDAGLDENTAILQRYYDAYLAERSG